MTAGRRLSGMTLLEVLVVAVLLTALFGIIYTVITPGLRAWSRSEASAQAQQQCLVVVSTISREFQYSHPYFTQIAHNLAEDPPGTKVQRDAIVFLSSLDENGNEAPDAAGDPLWQRIIYVYHDGDSHQVCIRRTKINPPTAEPHAVSIASLHPAPDDRIIARNVKALGLSMTADNAPPLYIHVEAQVEARASALDAGVVPLLVTEPLPDT